MHREVFSLYGIRYETENVKLIECLAMIVLPVVVSKKFYLNKQLKLSIFISDGAK